MHSGAGILAAHRGRRVHRTEVESTCPGQKRWTNSTCEVGSAAGGMTALSGTGSCSSCSSFHTACVRYSPAPTRAPGPSSHACDGRHGLPCDHGPTPGAAGLLGRALRRRDHRRRRRSLRAQRAAAGHSRSRPASMIALLVAPWAIIAHQVTRHGLNLEALLAAITAYILVGMFFAFVYNLMSQISADPLFGETSLDSLGNQLFFSFTALHHDRLRKSGAVGTGGQAVAIAEGITGQLFLITAVARIMRARARSAPRPATSEGEPLRPAPRPKRVTCTTSSPSCTATMSDATPPAPDPGDPPRSPGSRAVITRVRGATWPVTETPTGATDVAAPDAVAPEFVLRRNRGRDARTRAPRSRQGPWHPSADRPDPVALLEGQAATRDLDIVPLRYERMSASPFAFFAGPRCSWRPTSPPPRTTGITVQLCGDAHLSNFGLFGTPERRLIFDMNDLRRDVPGAVRVGSSTAGDELRGGRAAARLLDGGDRRLRPRVDRRVPEGDAAGRRCPRPRRLVRPVRTPTSARRRIRGGARPRKSPRTRPSRGSMPPSRRRASATG